MVGVFGSLDLFLFYVFFEAMLIPIYFLIGLFGGPQRSVRRREVPALQPLRRAVMLAALIGLYIVSGRLDTRGPSTSGR